MSQMNRIRWHCRRGMLELDLLLQRFSRQQLERLDAGELGVLEELLEFSDTDLFDVVMGRTTPAERRFQPVVEMLRSA